MLTKLFSSAVRVKILKLLVMHPDDYFSISEIARKVGSLVRTVSKELGKLVETGAILEEVRPVEINKKSVKIKHYIADGQFFLFPELRDILFKSQIADLASLKNKIKGLGKIDYLVLSGRFTGEENSLVDLLIIGKIVRDKLDKFISHLEKEFNGEINYTIMEPADFKYRQEIGDMFLFGILNGKKIEIINNLKS